MYEWGAFSEGMRALAFGKKNGKRELYNYVILCRLAASLVSERSA